MDWWIWAVVGLVLFGAELLSPGGFYILFFGAGALLVALLTGVGLLAPPWAQWLVFTLSSVLALMIFRRRLLDKFKASDSGKEMDNLVGEMAVARETIAAGASGKVELRGVTWNAKNEGGASISKGERCRVVRADGLTVLVRAESDSSKETK